MEAQIDLPPLIYLFPKSPAVPRENPGSHFVEFEVIEEALGSKL
jgi:hypothetical protein